MARSKDETDWPMQAVGKASPWLPRNGPFWQNHSSFSLLTPFPPRHGAELSHIIPILGSLPSILVATDLTCLALDHVETRPPPAPSQLNVRLRGTITYLVRRKDAPPRAECDIADHGPWLVKKQHDCALLPSRLLLGLPNFQGTEAVHHDASCMTC